MAKTSQAKVLSNDEFAAVLDGIEHHRYPAKIVLIIQISFKLGLRAQEMALLRIREIAAVSDEIACGYKIKDVLVLPKSFTKGARAMAAIGSNTKERTSVLFCHVNGNSLAVVFSLAIAHPFVEHWEASRPVPPILAAWPSYRSCFSRYEPFDAVYN